MEDIVGDVLDAWCDLSQVTPQVSSKFTTVLRAVVSDKELIQRLAALYNQEVIELADIDLELGEQNWGLIEPENKGLAQSVEEQLAAYFKAHGRELPAAGLYDRVIREVERPLIILTLQATRGNQIKAANVLGLNRNTLRKKIKTLDIPVTRNVK